MYWMAALLISAVISMYIYQIKSIDQWIEEIINDNFIS